ncbi:MAG: hypothetical protein SV062_14280, partial [Thermodesulfobacteriota bacterium]|nr:hypothetical protein [Thermodesulfobacteriota bacterium]
MKCPKCGYISFDYLESCKKCNKDLVQTRELLGIISPVPPELTLDLGSGEGKYISEGASQFIETDSVTSTEEAEAVLDIEELSESTAEFKIQKLDTADQGEIEAEMEISSGEVLKADAEVKEEEIVPEISLEEQQLSDEAEAMPIMDKAPEEALGEELILEEQIDDAIKIEDSARDITAAIEEPVSLEEESVAQEEITLDDGGVKEDMEPEGIEEISLAEPEKDKAVEESEQTIEMMGREEKVEGPEEALG